MTILSVWESGYRHMTNNTRPILAPADIAGIKFRTNENSMKVKMYEAVGGSAVIMAFSDVYTGLRTRPLTARKILWQTSTPHPSRMCRPICP